VRDNWNANYMDCNLNLIDMFTYATYFDAICPITGELKRYFGETIEAISEEDAFRYAQENGLEYLHIAGILESYTDEETGETTLFNSYWN